MANKKKNKGGAFGSGKRTRVNENHTIGSPAFIAALGRAAAYFLTEHWENFADQVTSDADIHEYWLLMATVEDDSSSFWLLKDTDYKWECVQMVLVNGVTGLIPVRVEQLESNLYVVDAQFEGDEPSVLTFSETEEGGLKCKMVSTREREIKAILANDIMKSLRLKAIVQIG